MPKLITLSYSPWSERARFALKHHGMAFEEVAHEPVVGELAWRFRTGRWLSRATVPVYLDGKTRLFDSFAIAKHVDGIGNGSKLFPSQHLAAIERWNAASERGLASARRRSLARTLTDDEALEDNLASLAPKGFRKPLLPVAKIGVQYMQAKYGASSVSESAIDDVLKEFREALAGKLYLLGEFTYADITMASALQMVDPVSNTYVPMLNSTRRTFRDEELAKKYPDLLQWRDAVYARYRKPV